MLERGEMARHVTCVGERRNAHKGLVGHLKERDYLYYVDMKGG